MKRFFLSIISLVLCCPFCALALSDTVQIHFNLDEDKLRKTEQALLEGLVYEDVMNNQTSILIIGYADYIGSTDYNINLSKRRAKAIQQQLIKLNIPATNIKLCIGKGEISRHTQRADGYPTDRRVDVVITKMTKSPTKKSAQPVLVKNKPPAKTITTLTEAKVGQTIRLENIYFVLGRHFLTDNSYPALEMLYETMNSNPNLKIQIEGHICCMRYGFDAEDEDTKELKLSENRAKYIYEYLTNKGIEKDRMKYIGYGRSKPLVKPERTTADEDRNRRVEIRIMEK